MPWVKITDKAHENEKLQEASGEAVKLWLMALSWANSELTDGHIPLTRAPRLTYMRKPEKVIGELLERRMWHRASQVCRECLAERIENNVTDPVPSSGYYIHGYFGSGREKFQRPRWAILADRVRLAEAGRRGGLAKLSAKQDASEDDEGVKLDAKQPAKPSAKPTAKLDAKHGAKQPAQARTPVTPYPRSPGTKYEGDDPDDPPIPDAPERLEDPRATARNSSQGRGGLRHISQVMGATRG